jgi:hypothetical protein
MELWPIAELMNLYWETLPPPWNNYDATFNSTVVVNTNTAPSNLQWDALQGGDANLLIQNCTNSTSTSPAIKSTALGEGYFMRAYNYLRLVSQYGPYHCN